MLAQTAQMDNRTMMTVPAEYAHTSAAWQAGYMDAADGYPFAPEMYFGARHQRAAYTLGFLERRPGNVAAQRWWQRFEIAIDLECDEREDEMMEQEAVRYGMF